MIDSYTEQRYEFGNNDAPMNPPPGVMFVFYEDDVPTMVDLMCPCGCGRSCPTHLVPPGEAHKGHRWEFHREPSGNVTLKPSIRFTAGCYAHFNITDGKTVIHDDSGRKPT